MKTVITLVLAVLLLLFAVLAMAFRVLAVKGGRFPSHHHATSGLRERGVECASAHAKELKN